MKLHKDTLKAREKLAAKNGSKYLGPYAQGLTAGLQFSSEDASTFLEVLRSIGMMEGEQDVWTEGYLAGIQDRAGEDV